MNVTRVNISIEDWCRMVADGVEVPVTVRLQGYSMQPLIRFNVDPVTVVPLKGELVPGMIVVFQRHDGVYVAHRLYRIGGDAEDVFQCESSKVLPEGWVQTWGDNCINPDAPVKVEKVIGQIVAMNKNDRMIRLDTEKQYAYGIKWMKHYRKIWNLYKRGRGLLGRIKRKIMG